MFSILLFKYKIPLISVSLSIVTKLASSVIELSPPAVVVVNFTILFTVPLNVPDPPGPVAPVAPLIPFLPVG